MVSDAPAPLVPGAGFVEVDGDALADAEGTCWAEPPEWPPTDGVAAADGGDPAAGVGRPDGHMNAATSTTVPSTVARPPAITPTTTDPFGPRSRRRRAPGALASLSSTKTGMLMWP